MNKARSITFFLTLIIVSSYALSSCRDGDENDTKVDRGLFITPELKDTVPGVMFIGNCTGTAVSDTTLITAGHCVETSAGFSNNRVDTEVCIRSGAASGTCTRNVFAPESYIRRKNFKYDVAVARYCQV